MHMTVIEMDSLFLFTTIHCGIYEPSQTYLQQVMIVTVRNIHD